MRVDVERVSSTDRARVEACARMMAASEPWVTLRRSFEASVRTLGDPGKELYAVSDGGETAGFVLLDMRGPLCGYIQSVCVCPAQRSRGLGTALIQWVEDRVFRESPNVFLCVSSFNDRARRLYERLGYEVVGGLSAFIVRGHDEVLYRKTRGPWAEFGALRDER
jgi:predicted GNAT family acetyltransferase